MTLNMRKKKILWVVYWSSNKDGYTEFTEAWATESEAKDAAEKYQGNRTDITFSYDFIEVMS
jgi:hypothetical protein